MRGIRKLFRLSLLRPRDVDRDVDEELEFHLAMRAERLRREGLPEHEANRVAADHFGNLDGIRDDCLREAQPFARTERIMQYLDEARRDVQFAVRSLWHAKAFTIAVVLTLALGIGANATIFSVISAVVLHPVNGTRDPESLFVVDDVVSYPVFTDVSTRLPDFTLAAVSERRFAIGHGTSINRAYGDIVSGNYFSVLGVRAALGRTLQPADDAPGIAPVGVLAYSFWNGELGADSSIVGKTVTVNGAPVTVVGIAARDFRGLTVGAGPMIWVPLNSWPSIVPSTFKSHTLQSTNWGWLRIAGRLKPGANTGQAEGAISSAMTAIDPSTSQRTIKTTATVRPLQSAALESRAHDAVSRFAAILAGVVALVLLTACANIAGLLLSRAAYREREIAVRVALGAGRGRLVRQLLTEALVLAAAGGAAGLVVFAGARSLIAHISLPGGVDGSAVPLALDARLVAFAVGITIVTGLLVGLVPAISATKSGMLSSMRAGASTRGAKQQRLRGVLVSAQVAVGLALLVGTGLFARAVTRAFAVNLGFRTERLATLSVDPGLAQMDAPHAAAYFTEVSARIAALPGVNGVSWIANIPLTSDQDGTSAEIPGYSPAPGERMSVEYNLVGAHFHELLGIPLVSGRGFDEHDTDASVPVIVVNETLEKRYFGGRSALGATITMNKIDWRIVGVAHDAKYHQLGETAKPYAYIPLMQLPAQQFVGEKILVRASGDINRRLPGVVKAAAAVNPSVPVYDAFTLADRLRSVLAPQLAGVWLLGMFSVLALVVAAVGIYGIVAYAVSQRTREIGIRMALGARRESVMRLVLGANLAYIGGGVVAGVGLSVFLGRAMTSFLFGVGATDALTFGGMSLVMLLVGVLASYFPARRAVRIDPLLALRADS